MSVLQLGGSQLEELADGASTREALGGFNLRQARNHLAGLLSQIGRTQEFSTYTKHDISHIDALLRAADWIIPSNTFRALTVADALVTVLAIYVHDLGMLVTKDEFAERNKSGFPGFKDSILGDESARGVDFRDRLSNLDDEDREHFLYEEFVRVHHAERIESWILGKGVERFGVSTRAATIVREVLAALPTVVRNDVAVIAKSHHSDDIYDTNIYQLRRVYGNDPQDVANLQYAAIVLRTVDLLHITKDRTPTVQYRLSTPVDPMGQREWRKQAAVRAVVGHIPEDGEPVIEVHASFDEPVGYFALMSYLDYCDSQLSQSRKWVEQSAQRGAGSYEFPWGSTVREQIETLGFLRHQFRFTFDQQKVLELLTGHTLYNDASVAIRELVQNSIDAVRLRKFAAKSSDAGVVAIDYDTASRRLRVRDDGVGMTQAILENHFLRVGSSSYQSKEFKDRFPEFASISRFGIGVLSAFMIADEVRVATRSLEDSTGRQLVLNSVHGRYLIRDLDEASEVSSRVGPHGTEIELQLRPSSELSGSMIDLLRRWILLPGCAVTCTIDGGAGEAIGWSNASAALEGLMEFYLQSTDETRVVTKSNGGTTIAVAEVWNEVFKEWDVVHLDDDQPGRRARVSRIRSSGESTPLPLEGISIQGIRVTDALPGWRSSPLVLVDVSGDMAPRTNVARTDLEAGPPLDALTEDIFEALVGTIEDQIEEISHRLSERLALKEVRHLFRQMVTSPGSQSSILHKPQVMRKVLEDSRLHPVEVGESLSRVSAASLREGGFTVLVGPAADDAVRFMDWLPTPRGMLYMLRQGGFLTEETDASSPLLGGQDALFAYNQLLWDSFEISKVRALEGGKSLLLNFVDGQSGWVRDSLSRDAVSYINQLLGDFDRRVFRSRGEFSNVYCIDEKIQVENLPDGAEVFFVGRNRMFSANSPFVRARLLTEESGDAASAAALYLITQRVTPYKSINVDPEDTEAEALREFLSSHPSQSKEVRELLELLLGSSGQMPVWSASYVGQRRSDSQN